ncbi:MAG: hypothetical protein UX13_C0032G0004 [Candidatus Woesebacteria bacterium GW2011_GWB1_45_5]|uniref:Uncharacterized protein n=1 Tax=Candidatus Woesebacteria bacterium GW2011_GWB1_45_5 TaxID=1618581 RepID=A0A0G1QM73_9BACT|nr:MAG: hypothetical protein UX13_C0032G0004 [Candidatus Woesebacteria bacterium GW2011_GWB1_45_5]
MGTEAGHLNDSLENQIDRKEVNFKRLVLQSIFSATASLGYKPFAIEFNKEQTKHRPDGSTVVITYPVVIYGKEVALDSLKQNFGEKFIFMNPKAKDTSYILQTGERGYGDGEVAEHIAITKATHPTKHRNLGEWVASWREQAVNPHIHPSELDREGLPGILIAIYHRGLTAHMRGEDKLINKVFASL